MQRIRFTIIFVWLAMVVAAQNVARTYYLSDTTRYSEVSGYGYDVLPTPGKQNTKPFYYSVNVPDGNYLVTLKIGHKKKAGVTTVRAESRRLFVRRLATKKGEFVTESFIVNKRTPFITENESVKIKAREKATFTWDDKITFEFNGENPLCESIRIELAPATVPTVFLYGNSTVTDQDREPWASWGQMIPAFFNDKVAFANYAESGESANTFIAAGRMKKAISQMKAGDYVFIEFGHNDMKQTGPGKGAWYSFMTNLKILIDEARAKGATPVLVTPTQRRRFENGRNQNTHGEYPDAMHWLANKENIPLIDLNEMTRIFFDALGEERSKKALVHYPANTFPGQKQELADNTHFSTYGAYQVAQCVINGMLQVTPELTKYLKPGFCFHPAQPDSPDTFVWELSPLVDKSKPDGD